EVWVAGRTPSGTRQSNGIALLHFAGGTWARVETSFGDVTDIGPAGPSDAWLLAYDSLSVTNGMPELAHIHGDVVKQEVKLDPRDGFTKIRMLSPSDGWAVGQAYVSGNETDASPTVTRPVALHYDGSRWTEANIGVSAQARAIDVLDQGTAWAYTTVRTPATGPEHIAVTLREVSARWQDVAWPFKGMLSTVHLTWVSANACWEIGQYLLPDTTRRESDGTLVRVTNYGYALLRYANGAWHQYGRL